MVLAVLGAVLELRGSPLLRSVPSGDYAVLGAWASSWLLLRGLEALGVGLAEAGAWCGGGPPEAGWLASSDGFSPCSYLTAASPSPPPARPRSCRTHPSTVTMIVVWKSLRRHPASHPRGLDLVPWLCLRITMSVPPPTAA